MSSFKSVSLILYVGNGDTDQQIWNAVRAIGKSNWRVEVLLVDRDGSTNSSGTPNSRITYRPIPTVYPSLELAIRAAKHPTVAISDPEFEFAPHQWAFLVDQTDPVSLLTAYQTKHSLRGYKRFLVWVYTLIVRVLLKTGKTELRPGLTLFQRDEWITLSDEISQFSSIHHRQGTSPDTFENSRLAAQWRLHSRRVIEVQIGSPTIATAQNSKSILKKMRRAVRFWWNTIMFPRHCDELPTKQFKRLEKITASLLLVGVACFLLFHSLGFPLFEPDEARNSQLAINVLETGQWLSLSLDGEHYWDKPPIQIWAIAVSYQLFGATPFATRLPIALAGLFTVCTMMLIGKRLVGFRAAWLGTALLLLTSGFVFAGRYATMDASLTAMTLVLFLCGYVATQPRSKRRHAFAAGLACGVGLLIKGPVIIALCVPPLLVAYWLAGSRLNLTSRRWVWFAVPAMLIAAPWYVATAIVEPDFLAYFFWKHNFLRFTNAFNHREPFYFYWLGIFLFMFPASYLLPSVAKFLTSRKIENRGHRTREHGFLLLAAVWILVFFSISEAKLPTYIVPAFPIVCLLMGVLLERKIFSRPGLDSSLQPAHATVHDPASVQSAKSFLAGLPQRAPLELLFWISVVSAILLFAFQIANASIAILAIVAAVASVVAVVMTRQRRKSKYAWSCFGVVGFCFVLMLTHQLMPTLAQSRSIHQVAKRLQSSDEFSNAPVVFFGREQYGAAISLDETNVFHFDETETSSLVEFLTETPRAIIVSSKRPMQTLRHDLPWTIKLQELENSRHVYLSQPNPRIIAREKPGRLLR